MTKTKISNPIDIHVGSRLRMCRLMLNLSQEKLAHLVNLSRNSIIPILGEFQKRGFIEAKYGSIVVSDVKGLAAAIAS